MCLNEHLIKPIKKTILQNLTRVKFTTKLKYEHN